MKMCTLMHLVSLWLRGYKVDEGGAGGELAYLLEVIFIKLYLRSPCCHLLLTQVLWRGMCYRTRSF